MYKSNLEQLISKVEEWAKVLDTYLLEEQQITLKIHEEAEKLSKDYLDWRVKIREDFDEKRDEAIAYNSNYWKEFEKLGEQTHEIMMSVKNKFWSLLAKGYSYGDYNFETGIIDSLTLDEGLKYVENEIAELKDTIEGLNSFSTSKSMAMGALLPPFRKKYFYKIGMLGHKIWHDIEGFKKKSDKEMIAEPIRLEERKVMQENEAETFYIDALKKLYHNEERDKRSENKNMFLGKALDIVEEEVNLVTEGVGFGVLSQIIPFPAISEFREKYQDYMDEYLNLSIPITGNPYGNILFTGIESGKMKDVYISMALELLMSKDKDNIHIIFSDVAGLGSGYKCLQALVEKGIVEIWRNPNEVRRGLESLAIQISTSYSELGRRYDDVYQFNEHAVVKKPYTFLFIDGLERELKDGNCDEFQRIIENGVNAGVSIIANHNYQDDKVYGLKQMLDAIDKDVLKLKISQNYEIPFGYVTKISMEYKIDQKKLDFVFNQEYKNQKSQNLLLEEYMCPKFEWHTYDASNGIDVPIGYNSAGKEVVLTLSERQPFVLMIGRPRFGKSVLLNTIALQILSKYSESEVHIAVLDLKMGNGFREYAVSGLKAVEAVVSDTSIDTMCSFLEYYVSEIGRRQALFDEMGTKEDCLIYKYEDYRKENKIRGNQFPDMPRIVLIVDEFQSLFCGNKNIVRAVDELVRKGCTYGIHLIMASQTSGSSHSFDEFSIGLQDFFTGRFVFNTSAQEARKLLSDINERENPGIRGVELLEQGVAVYNKESGATENNINVRCFFPQNDIIKNICKELVHMRGKGNCILLQGANAISENAVEEKEGYLNIGKSTRLHYDRTRSGNGNDGVKDDGIIAVEWTKPKSNMLVTGNEYEVIESIMMSAIRAMKKCDGRVYVYGSRDSVILRDIFEKNADVENYIDIIENENMQIGQLEVAVERSKERTSSKIEEVHIFLNPERSKAFEQELPYDKPEGMDALNALLSDETGKGSYVIVYSDNFANIKNYLSYVLPLANIHITYVGNQDDVNRSIECGLRFEGGNFDIPVKNQIKAYYYDKDSDKEGRVILYKV